MKKILLAAALSLGFSAAASATTVNVGGVVWDPDLPASGADKDFTARFDFNQWFTSAADQVADADGASPSTTTTILDPATVGAGDVLQGVGEVTTINGSSAFCPSCELTFVFGGFAVVDSTTVTGGWLRFYVDDTPDYNNAGAPLDAAAAADGDLWLSLSVDDNLSFTLFAPGFGIPPFASVISLASVVGGLAASNLDTNSFATSDTNSGNGGNFRLTDIDGDTTEEWIATSSGQLLGNSIPEPASIALLGLGLLGIGAATRRKKS